MENSEEKKEEEQVEAAAGEGGGGGEQREEEMDSPSQSSSESEDDSDGDGLAAFMWGRRFRGQLPHDQGEQQEEEGQREDGGEPKYERRFFWTHYVDSGFPNRVNHAVCAVNDRDGCHYAYSLGGYHADEDERTVIQADTHGGPFFRSTPIDIHCLDFESRTWSKCTEAPEHQYMDVGSFQRTRTPGCRYGHTVCQFKGRLYMYGGRNDEDGSFSQVDCYDTKTHAWDLNRVKHFMRLDIGIQMELCGSCVTSNLQGTSIVDKIFHDDCIDFLCHEARISNQPVFDNSLQVYPVQHTCARGTEVGPPSYLESQRHTFHGTGNFDSRNVDDSTPPELPSRNFYAAHSDVNSGGSAGSRGASLTTFHPSTPGNNTDSIPPRDITRRNHESAIPAVAHPYMNFQPQLFQQQNGSSSFDSPYQISSRIIITNSGEVQYERNILGNKVQHQGGFHFKTTMPLPPRSTDTATPTNQARATPTFHVSRSPNRTASLPVTHDRREAQRSNRKLEKRASELSDECDDSYVFIPDVVYDPSRVPLPQPSGNFEPPCSTETPYGGSNFSDPSFGGPQTTHRPSYEGPTVCIPPFQGSDFHDPSFEGSSVAPQPQSGGSTAPLISQVPISGGEIEGTSSFSGDYEDVLVFSQQLSIRPSNGAIPHVVATQEIRSSDSPIPVPRGDHRTTRGILSSDSPIPVPHGYHPIPCTPPPMSPQSRSRSPNKPQVKPRRRKPLSESDSSVDWTPPAMSSSSQKSLTIPNTRTLNSDLSPHHTLDLTSDDGFSLSPSPTESSHSHPHTVTRSQLPHPPLTPPIPRPRPSFGVRVRVQRSEDDIEVGRNRSDSAHNRNRLSQFTAPHVPNSDL